MRSMNFYWIKTILCTAALIFMSGNLNTVSAQQIFLEDSVYIFEMKDGKVFKGLVKVREKDYLYEVQAIEGMLLLLEEDIEKIYLASDLNTSGITRNDSMHYSRYLFSNSSYNVQKGELYFQNYFIAGNQFIYGISDRFSLGLGLLPMIIFEGSGFLGYSISPKLSFDYRNGQGAFAVMGGLGRSFGLQPTNGLLHLTNTFGARDKHLTIGLLSFYVPPEYSFRNIHMTLSGFLRLNNRWALLTDNALISSNQNGFSSSLADRNYFISIGARYMKKRFSLTLGALLAFDTSNSPEYYPFPWLSSGITLNKRK